MAPRSTRRKPQELVVDDVRVTLTRKRVRNINLRVRRDGSVAVSAPSSVPLSDIEDLIRQRSDWIRQAQARVAEAEQKSACLCDEGAQVVLWGETLTLRLEPVTPVGRWPQGTFAVEGDTLVAHVDERIVGDDEESQTARDRLLDHWLQEQLIAHITEMLPRCEARVGKRCGTVRLRRMTSRWGSCNVKTGTVALSTELVHHPPRCLEYVITHELCHLHEPSHNDRFHALMDRFYPGWQAVRKELNGR